MPLLSQHTVQQLVPGSIAAECDYPLASAKRNVEFHTLFRSVPELDPLIEFYKCALHKEILLQGHIYITEHHLCFNANIFGWVTNLVIAFSEITSIEKRMTAMIIPNGIQVSTIHAKHVFASFMSRDMAFDQMYKVWQKHHDTGKPQTLQPRNHSDFSLKRHDDDDDDLLSESGTATDISSSLSVDDEEGSDEAIVKTPKCKCDSHLGQVALDSTYKGTVEVMHELLFQTNFFPKAMKKYEGCHGN
ncbi:GRAM domain-containing protein [Zychaea mexicana]|uniref:GRAM domain-containing protein n=1 Tax=Zychaea mexicana TaxID=64656 RepID=UPI0022FE9A53|nr:GRAM domain-containing protein [Zychaea mexicana]KAI9493531.1 GRAM domain-containing protein [Zychaea mexicana]